MYGTYKKMYIVEYIIKMKYLMTMSKGLFYNNSSFLIGQLTFCSHSNRETFKLESILST